MVPVLPTSSTSFSRDSSREVSLRLGHDDLGTARTSMVGPPNTPGPWDTVSSSQSIVPHCWGPDPFAALGFSVVLQFLSCVRHFIALHNLEPPKLGYRDVARSKAWVGAALGGLLSMV